jgi:hypothetical protein
MINYGFSTSGFANWNFGEEIRESVNTINNKLKSGSNNNSNGHMNNRINIDNVELNIDQCAYMFLAARDVRIIEFNIKSVSDYASVIRVDAALDYRENWKILKVIHQNEQRYQYNKIFLRTIEKLTDKHAWLLKSVEANGIVMDNINRYSEIKIDPHKLLFETVANSFVNDGMDAKIKPGNGIVLMLPDAPFNDNTSWMVEGYARKIKYVALSSAESAEGSLRSRYYSLKKIIHKLNVPVISRRTLSSVEEFNDEKRRLEELIQY